MDIIIEGFIYVWIFIIGTIPQIMMGGLTICVVATVLTYLEKKRSSDS